VKKAEVQIGATYTAKVSGTVVPVTILAGHSLGGWLAKNTITGRSVRIKSAQRLRKLVSSPPTEGGTP
jgi:hypothetical protein